MQKLYRIAPIVVALVLCNIALADDQLPKDPNNVYGQFENGMKYIIRKNANPPGKVALNLHVKTGAINESQTQNGLAHFLEHMSFNGSEHYKPGELVPLMTKMGMIFGADSNAHTNWWETVYKLTLPDTKPETLTTGLTIFQDFASTLTLTDVEINEERGVILEESRGHKSPEERIQKKMFRTLFPNSQFATHDIIGDEEQIKHFPRTEFADYWNTWYRPENMTLVIVGDIDPQQVIDLAKDKLGTFKARAEMRTPTKAGLTTTSETKAFIFTDPEQVAGEVSMLCLKPSHGIVTTVDQYRTETVDDLAEWIVNRRFQEMVEKGGAPFRHASASSQDFFHEATLVNADAEGEPQDWNKMLDTVIAEVNRAVDHGFTQAELDLAKSNTLAGAQRAVDTEGTRDSNMIVGMLSGAIGLDRPILSASQRLDLIKKTLDTVTTDQLHKAFVANFKSSNWMYVMSMPEGKMTLPSTADVLAAASAAWAKKTEAPEEKKMAGSILAGEPVAGKVVSKETDKDLDVTTVKFANGAVMHHKFSDYKKDQIWVQVTFPGGAIAETAENKGVSEVASLMLAHPATSRFTSSQARDLMTGKNVRMGGGVGIDALSIAVSGSAKDMPAGMQLAHAVLTDGVLEQSALDEWKKNELQQLKKKPSNPQMQLFDAIASTVYGGDVRMAPMNEEQVNRQERSPAGAWFKHIANHSAIEVGIVGDIKLDDAIELVGKYIGSLPSRTTGFSEFDGMRQINRGAGPYVKTQHFSGITPMAIVLAGYISCDETSPDRRPLSLAAQVLSDRMITRIREKEQLVYSIDCENAPGRGLHGTGMLLAAAPCAPENADKLGNTIIEMLKDFADKGPTDQELANAKKQMANQLDSQMKEPTFWLAQIAEMQYHKRPLSDVKELPAIYQTFTAQQLQDVVKKYFRDDAMLKVEVSPEKQAEKKSEKAPEKSDEPAPASK